MSTLYKARIAAALAVALGATTPALAQPTTPMPEEAPTESESCPAFMRGAKLSVSNTERGVTFRVTAAQDPYVAPLREMLRRLALLIERHADATAAQPPDPESVAIPPVDITIKEIGDGAVVSVRAKQVTDVGLLQLQARAVERFWESSDCINGTGSDAMVQSISL